MLDKVSPFWQAAGWQGKEKQAECTSHTLVGAHQQLHPHGDAGVPAQWQQADVTGHNGWAQQVLHRGGAVRIPIEDLKSGKHVIMPVSIHSLFKTIHQEKLG